MSDVVATEPDTQWAGRRLALLDGARLSAALAVVVFHYTARPSPAWGVPVEQIFPQLQTVSRYGAVGVYLFFMISGFVVLMSTWGRSPADFAASRVARLYPAYWFSVIVTAALLIIERGTELGRLWADIGVTGVLANLTMLQEALGVPHVAGVYWTLWVELKFYLAIGILALLGFTVRRVLAFALLWPIVGALARTAGEPLLVELLIPDQAPYFAVGMLLYLVHRGEGTPLVAGALAVNLAFAVSLSTTAVRPFYLDVTGLDLSPVVTSALVLLAAGGLAIVTITRLSRFDARWLAVAGALTYPLYLLHELFGWKLLQVVHPALPPYLSLALVIGIMLAFAYLVHRFVERPLAPLLRRAVRSGLREVARRDARSGSWVRPVP